jgi:lysozyme
MRRVIAASVLLSLSLGLPGCGPPDETDGVEQGLTLCPPVTVEGIDVYSGQGAITWQTARGSGRRFGFTKATQGNYYHDGDFASNWAEMGDAGVLRGPYHFFDPTIDGVAQANTFLATLSSVGGIKPGDLPPALDIECPTSSSQSGSNPNCEYTGNSGWAPPATLAQRAWDWLHTVEVATGRKPIVYSYVSWFSGVGFTDPALADYPLWIASLSTCVNVPAPWNHAVFWQYSFTGSVPGISGQVDLDRFVGSQAELVDFSLGLTDAGASHDAGTVHDAGPASDAGMGHDAGASPDAGVGHDAGSPHDAGTTPDAGTGRDAGAVSDAGGVDAGTPSYDAGVTEDAGVSIDAGLPSWDAGTSSGGTGHCGCSEGEAAPLILWVMWLWFARRRRGPCLAVER